MPNDLLLGGDGDAQEALPTFVASTPIAPPVDDDVLVPLPVTPADFKPETLRRAFHTMLLSRQLDEKMLNLIKQGKGFFHIGCAGHEAAQAAVGLLSEPGTDWFSFYYRDLCMYLSLGASSRDVLLHHMAKADDPNSGGRQMSEHFSEPDLNILTVSSSVGAQFLPALGVGMALQRDSANRSYVYASCGDGATSQGAFHEALNWATRAKAPVLFMVQDNKYAISVPVADQTAGGSAYKLARGYEGLKRIQVDGTDFFKTYAAAQAALAHIRSGQGPVCFVADVVRLLPHSSSDNHAKYRTSEELESDRQVDPIARMEMQLIEAGVLTEDAVAEMRRTIKAQVNADAVWAAAQADPTPESATALVYFEGDLGLTYGKDAEPEGAEPVVLVDAINHALHEEMARNERVLVYGEDVAGGKGGVFTATRGLTDRFGKDRCFNSPLAEASVIGTAVGLSAAGYKPVVEIQFADYIWPAMQHLRNAVATYRYRSGGRAGCPMVIRVPAGGYIHGGLCHSQNIESIFGHMPGFKIAMPSNAADAKGLLKAAIRMQDPVLFLEHKALYRAAAARAIEPGADYLLPFGKAATVREGTDLTIVTYGMMVHKAVNVARMMAKEGVSVEIIDIRTMLPLDMDTILASVKKTNRALVVYEDHEFIGFGAEICAQIADAAFTYLDAPVRRVAGAFTFVPFADPLERAVLPQDEDILEGVRSVLAF
ncbi:MAG: dehydrogenase E1 component subunit alpha/beta [Bacteroidota bacterium]